MYKIEIALKTLSHLHIASTETARLRSDGKVQYGKTPGVDDTRPLVRTCREPIFVESSISDTNEVHDKMYIPVIPANTIRGAIRRESAKLIFKKLISSGEKLDLLSTQLLLNLAHSGKLNATGIVDYDRAMLARKGLFSGLWGGGSNLHRSAIITPTLYPVCEATLDLGLIPKDYQTHSRGKGFDLTSFITQIRRDSLASISEPDAEKVIENYDDEIRVHQAGILVDNASRKKGKEDGEDVKKYTLSNLFSHEVIPPGISFYGCIRLKDYVTPEQIGMIILSLKNIINAETTLGGLTRYGYGLLEQAESIKITDTQGDILEEDIVLGYIEEAENAIKDTSADSIINGFKDLEAA